MRKFSLPALALLVFPVVQATACTVCFGGTSGSWNRGFFWAILLLLALPFALMGSLLGLLVYHGRKHRRQTAVPT